MSVAGGRGSHGRAGRWRRLAASGVFVPADAAGACPAAARGSVAGGRAAGRLLPEVARPRVDAGEGLAAQDAVRHGQALAD